MTKVFEAGMLPDADKERLCRQLLAEFGATHVRPSGDGELIHSCVLPFGGHRHGDANPSASLNYKKLAYNCLGCQNSGGLLWFIGVCRNTSGTQARKWLNDQTGTGADEQSLSSLLQFFDAVYNRERDVLPPLPKMHDRILEQWMFIHPYLTEMRGIPEENIVALRVGWDPEANRIVIPHFWRGNLVGWQTRRLVKDGTPKYKSSQDFPKDRTIYNYYSQAHGEVCVVESPMSVIAKHHLSERGLFPFEATFGASVTDRQIKQMARHRRVYLFFDNDESGWNATHHVGTRLESYCDVRVVNNPYAADLADFDDATATRLLGDLVPFALWRPPMELQKWRQGLDDALPSRF